MQSQINMKKCPTKREIDKQVFFQICNSSINLSSREVMDRRQKEKGNTCVRNDKKRREKKKKKRQQMNKCISNRT